MLTGSQILVAFFLDLVFGDPKWFPHPVKGLGKLALLLEKVTRSLFSNQYLAGIICVGTITLGTFASVVALMVFLNRFDERLGIAVSIFLIYTTLSTKSLYEESKAVQMELAQAQLAKARLKLSNIVGRDTDDMDSEKITRACIETISENTSDGIVAPLFYAFIGGAPLAMTYKAINTLDSMFGYKSEKYKEFGWCAAKLDDLANWIPARLTGIFMILSAFILRLDARNALSTMLRDGQNHPSPNAGIPEAVVAGALKVQLGGPSSYQGVMSSKPWIGSPGEAATADQIRKTHLIMLTTAFSALVFFEVLFFSIATF